MQDRNMADETILNKLKEKYGFTSVQYLDDVNLGFSGRNFLITDDEKNYFVKRYHHLLTEEELREIHSVKFFYNERGVPAIVPLHTVDGDTFFNFDGRHFAVFPYVIGKTFTSMPSERAVASMGQVLAQQHILSRNHLDLLTKKKEFEGWDHGVFLDDMQMLLEKLDALEEQTEFDVLVRNFIEYKGELSKRYSSHTYAKIGLQNEYIIHGDFHYYNVFFSEDDTVSHVFDFERVMRGPRIIDLIYSLFLICFDFNLIKDSELALEFERAKTFLTSYHEAFPLKEEELKNGFLAYFLGELVHTHWIEFEHYLRDNKRVHALLPERIKRVTYVAENYAALEERFLSWLFR